jgi:hypothetical protein
MPWPRVAAFSVLSPVTEMSTGAFGSVMALVEVVAFADASMVAPTSSSFALAAAAAGVKIM